jgi:hypothetical protein
VRVKQEDSLCSLKRDVAIKMQTSNEVIAVLDAAIQSKKLTKSSLFSMYLRIELSAISLQNDSQREERRGRQDFD